MFRGQLAITESMMEEMVLLTEDDILRMKLTELGMPQIALNDIYATKREGGIKYFRFDSRKPKLPTAYLEELRRDGWKVTV